MNYAYIGLFLAILFKWNSTITLKNLFKTCQFNTCNKIFPQIEPIKGSNLNDIVHDAYCSHI